MKPVLLLLWFTAITGLVYTQQQPFKEVDRHARQVPASVARNPQAYSLYLTQPFNDTVQKIRAIYTWMATNISYDFDRYFSNNFSYNTRDSSMADITFYARRAICAGYAALFARFCQITGVECVTISGYARGFSSRANQPVQEVNHDWNAVRVNGQWRLLDLTWARDTSFNLALDEFWFMPPPEQFAFTHHPVKPQWQLLPQPMSQERFNRLPHFYARWFSMGFYGHTADVIMPDARGRFEITVNNDGFYEVQASLLPDADSLALTTEPLAVEVRKKKNKFRIRGRILERGHWKLTVYAGKLTAPRSPFAYASQYWGVAEFLINFP